MLKRVLIALIFSTSSAALLTGCGKSVEVTKTNKGFYSATDPDNVEILTAFPDRKFVELGTISTSYWLPSQTAKMHNALRQKSAALGTNAVVIPNSGVNYRGYLWSTGVAIRYE